MEAREVRSGEGVHQSGRVHGGGRGGVLDVGRVGRPVDGAGGRSRVSRVGCERTLQALRVQGRPDERHGHRKRVGRVGRGG